VSTIDPPAQVTADRESPLHPGVKLERRLPPFYAAFFYAFPAAVSWIWLYFQRPSLSKELWMPSAWARDLGLGLAAGLGVVGISVVCGRLFAWTRRLEAEFGWILGAQKGWEVVWIALLSGCAEEYLFRGALQQKFGIWVAVGVFAVIHWPLNPNFLPWPFVAGAIGLGLGGLAAVTGSLLAPAAAHVLINLINLTRITRRFAVWDETRVNHYVDTGKDT